MDLFSDKLFLLIGRILFPSRQKWEQHRRAKVLCGVVAFALLLGGALGALFWMIYNKTKV